MRYAAFSNLSFFFNISILNIFVFLWLAFITILQIISYSFFPLAAIEDNDQMVIPMLEKEHYQEMKKTSRDKSQSSESPDYVISDQGIVK